MTLEETINLYERQTVELYKAIPCDGCPFDKCKEEHRQLAEWLKELKAYKDFEDKGYVMCRFEVAQDDRHRTTKMVLDFSTKKLFDNIKEVKADANSDCMD